MRPLRRRSRARGAVTVEFATASIVFVALVVVAIELIRVTLAMSLATEATRVGARVASICSADGVAVRKRMRETMPMLTDANIVVTYPSAGCAPAMCDPIVVRLQNVRVASFIPFAGTVFTLPAFPATATVETLSSGTAAMCR